MLKKNVGLLPQQFEVTLKTDALQCWIWNISDWWYLVDLHNEHYFTEDLEF